MILAIMLSDLSNYNNENNNIITHLNQHINYKLEFFVFFSSLLFIKYSISYFIYLFLLSIYFSFSIYLVIIQLLK
jgi:hypothetical protein